MEKKLGPRREKWLEEYCTHGDAARAARNAGYKYETDADFRKEGSRLKKALRVRLHVRWKGEWAIRVQEHFRWLKT